MGILKPSSQELSDEIQVCAAKLAVLSNKAADADAGDLEKLGAQIAALTAKKSELEKRYAAALTAERDKAAEAQAKATAKAHADEIAAWQADWAALAAKWQAWGAAMVDLERAALAKWAEFEAMQSDISALGKRGQPLGLQVGKLPDDARSIEALSARMTKGGSPLRMWYRYHPT